MHWPSWRLRSMPCLIWLAVFMRKSLTLLSIVLLLLGLSPTRPITIQ